MNHDEYTQLVKFLEKNFTKIDEQFTKIDEEFVKVRKDLEQKIEEKSEDNKRYFGVLAESLRGEIRLVAEGVVGLQEQFERYKIENEKAHKDLMAAIKFFHTSLDERVTVLEVKVK